LSGRAHVIPTMFELRLPLAELTNYASRQTNKSFAAGELRWEFLDPTLEFSGNRIKLQVDIQVTGFPAAAKPGVHSNVDGQFAYELKDAERAVDQALELSMKLVSVRCKESGGLSQASVETTLAAILRSSVFDRTKEIYPFRVSDEPVKSFLEHVTVHEVT